MSEFDDILIAAVQTQTVSVIRLQTVDEWISAGQPTSGQSKPNIRACTTTPTAAPVPSHFFPSLTQTEGVVKSIISFSLTPPNVPVLIPKQFLIFEKIQKKSKKDPLYTKNPKNVILKPERVVKLNFSFSLTPQNMPVLIPKQFSDFEKTKTNPKKTPFTPKIQKTSF